MFQRRHLHFQHPITCFGGLRITKSHSNTKKPLQNMHIKLVQYQGYIHVCITIGHAVVCVGLMRW